MFSRLHAGAVQEFWQGVWPITGGGQAPSSHEVGVQDGSLTLCYVHLLKKHSFDAYTVSFPHICDVYITVKNRHPCCSSVFCPLTSIISNK